MAIEKYRYLYLVDRLQSGLGRWSSNWCTGFNEYARQCGTRSDGGHLGANIEELPQADHNTLAGTLNPQETLNAHTMTLFLRAPSDHPRNRLRSDLTRKAF